MKVESKIISIVIILLMLVNCEKNSSTNNSNVNIPDGTGHEYLSEYNFFEGEISDLIPADGSGIIPYDLNMPLFSDYALKKRFVYVPEGQIVPFDTTGVLNFPVGAVLIKNFYYEKLTPEEGFNMIETRLLINRSSGWQVETYEWNEEQTDAKRTVLGKTKNITINANGQVVNFNYSIPNTNQCKNCHGFEGQTLPIGPVVQNLNKNYTYEAGSANQLAKWMSEDILASSDFSNLSHWPEMDEVIGLDKKARAYLAVNCSSCHRYGGSATNSGLYLEYENQDSLSLGFHKTPVAAGAGSGGLTYVIEPGDASQSILHYRMNSTDVEVRMPELGRELLHDEGIELIRDWIDGM